MKAWLVTWEWMGDHAAVQGRIASILNPRLRHGRIKEHVEQLYLDTLGFADRLEVIGRRRDNPYSAKYHTLKRGGYYWERIHCGDNPHLYARKVENIRSVLDEDGEERLEWDEIPLPDLPRLD